MVNCVFVTFPCGHLSYFYNIPLLIWKTITIGYFPQHDLKTILKYVLMLEVKPGLGFLFFFANILQRVESMDVPGTWQAILCVSLFFVHFSVSHSRLKSTGIKGWKLRQYSNTYST